MRVLNPLITPTAEGERQRGGTHTKMCGEGCEHVLVSVVRAGTWFDPCGSFVCAGA